jgi:oligoendopeptidase F
MDLLQRRIILILIIFFISIIIHADNAFIPDGNMGREKVPEQYKWKLSPLFKNDTDFENNLKNMIKERQKIKIFKGKLKNSKNLRRCLDQYFKVRLGTNKLTLYASLRYDSYQKSSKLQSMRDKSLQAFSEFMKDSSFIRQEVLKLSNNFLELAYNKESQLKKYKPYLKELRRRRTRVLSSESENILSLAGDNLWAEIDLNEIPSDFEKGFEGLMKDISLPKIKDEKGKLVQLTLANYAKYRASKVRQVRRDTVNKFFSKLKQFQHAFAGLLSGQFRYSIFLAKARGYKSAIDAYLEKDNINPAVYRNLIDAIHKNLDPLHDYVKLRKEVMGIKNLHIYDLYTSMVPNVTMKFSYNKAKTILSSALQPLGNMYINKLKIAMDQKNGWIDIYPSKNKASGAFSASVYGVHPYVKMNYFDEYEDLSTLAHEYGHALHSFFSGKTQPYVTYNYVPFIAEIASTLNEKLLFDYIIKNIKNDDEKLFLLNRLIETIRTTIYRQTLFAEFELLGHTAAEKNIPLTAEFLNKTYKNLIKKYYGPNFTIGKDDDIEWAYIPHFYYKYYVYSYATGLSSGIAIAENIQKGGDDERDAYLGLLKAGSSKPPLDILKDAGVDLTKPQAVEAAARLMGKTIKQMRTIIKKNKK